MCECVYVYVCVRVRERERERERERVSERDPIGLKGSTPPAPASTCAPTQSYFTGKEFRSKLSGNEVH